MWIYSKWFGRKSRCFADTPKKSSNSEEWGQGADSKRLFEEMISKGVKLNFEYFLKTYWDK